MGSCYGEHSTYRDMAVAIYRGIVGSGDNYVGVNAGELLKDGEEPAQPTNDSGSTDSGSDNSGSTDNTS
jgi:hypothetical protein